MAMINKEQRLRTSERPGRKLWQHFTSWYVGRRKHDNCLAIDRRLPSKILYFITVEF